MGRGRSVAFLSQEQARDVVALAEQARRDLSHFAGREVTFGVEAVQLLDERIEDYLEAAPDPPLQVCILWASLLGEMFRRRHEGWWALRDGKLVIVCPTDGGNWRVVAVREQIDRRIASGMSESLNYFYNVTRIELKLG
jgi:hypothetical protein